MYMSKRIVFGMFKLLWDRRNIFFSEKHINFGADCHIFSLFSKSFFVKPYLNLSELYAHKREVFFLQFSRVLHLILKIYP